MELAALLDGSWARIAALTRTTLADQHWLVYWGLTSQLVRAMDRAQAPEETRATLCRLVLAYHAYYPREAGSAIVWDSDFASLLSMLRMVRLSQKANTVTQLLHEAIELVLSGRASSLVSSVERAAAMFEEAWPPFERFLKAQCQ